MNVVQTEFYNILCDDYKHSFEHRIDSRADRAHTDIWTSRL